MQRTMRHLHLPWQSVTIHFVSHHGLLVPSFLLVKQLMLCVGTIFWYNTCRLKPMKKDKMKKARRNTKRKRIKKIQSWDFWIGDGRHVPVTGVTPHNIRKRSSHTPDERKAPLQRVTTVTRVKEDVTHGLKTWA
ncbi:unnamed protein product [Vicia faba]|uniref:Uncharacterized protein n=1 Tax=Vicia faba TaxID=3906 RepID=A0AAV0Z672_VICFA|nr:unnamed protein product [Vicia faba]